AAHGRDQRGSPEAGVGGMGREVLEGCRRGAPGGTDLFGYAGHGVGGVGGCPVARRPRSAGQPPPNPRSARPPGITSHAHERLPPQPSFLEVAGAKAVRLSWLRVCVRFWSRSSCWLASLFASGW